MVFIICATILLLQFLLSLKKLKYGLSIMVFIFIVIPQEFAFITAIDLGLVRSSIIVGLLSLIFANFKKSHTYKNKYSQRYFTPLLIFLTLMLPSFIFGKTVPNLTTGILNWFVFKYIFNEFLIGIIIFLSTKEKDDFSLYINTIIFSVFILCIYGILEYLLNANPFLGWIQTQLPYNDTKLIEYSEGTQYASGLRFNFGRRIQSFSWHPIAYGGCLAIFLGLILDKYISNKTLKIKTNWFLFPSLLILVGLNEFLTLSRAPWISFIMTLTIISFKNINFFYTGNTTKKLLVTLLLAPLIIYYCFVGLGKLLEYNYEGSSSITMRIEQWNYLIQIIKANFFWGFGYQGVSEFLQLNFLTTKLKGFESIIFIYFYNYGFIGLLGLIYLFRSTIHNINRFKFSTHKIYFTAIFISYLFFVTISGEIRTFRVFWLVYSMLFAISALEHDSYIKTNVNIR